ncbi:TPM domain-containing protein [Hydrogenimonas urashimensis]|uniref:TPM domain-containing protein n=1 Tax=Hydrogenimonas urashimensis TaxID=2740515 RepID=UPI00191686CC|nr:TPM domain-containing protein [Hydrogenimonas urashimensis]
MPQKEVEKIEQMGRELYDKTKVPVFVAAVSDLNSSKPSKFIESVKRDHGTYILLYIAINPPAVNIFASEDAKKLIDIDQILSPLPWRGTIRPVMSPAFSKSDSVKQEVAIFNGYADIVDQVAASKGVKLTTSVGSESKTSFQIVRAIFYAILAFVIAQFIVSRKRRRAKE